VRFDAAMTLAKRHIQRLWFPAPGSGGAIASRAEHAISTDEFNRRIPNEFWREVVDRCATEAPNTLLLAEAFWMMEGYFVRTLGMHRVYNSAFMNMLKNEENAKYRSTIKNTMEFDPEILKRFVNFMNNPDEETAVAQFGKGDKYFGICTLLVTMPGLPMFGHGQIEGFEEKYGMEYRRSYREEQPDGYLVSRHEHEIFPLMKRRSLFSGSAMFRIYDMYCEGGSVNENVFAYSNRAWINGYEERALIFYNNSYYETSGWVNVSDPEIPDGSGKRRDKLSEALAVHGDPSYFTLLREQKSNLWFIRSSKAISEKGFFAGLKGYETQVYLDIYEVEDDAKGRWARLNNDLNGAGVPDPLAAIKDIFLGELYYRFMELFKPEILEKLNDAELIKKPVELFIKTAAHFITGADYDPWTWTDEDGVSVKFTQESNAKIWDEFSAFIARMIKINAELKNAKTPFLVSITKRITNKQLFSAVTLSFAVLAMIRSVIGKEAAGCHAANLAFDHWDLGRKMREIFCRFGASEQEAWRITDIARAVLNWTCVGIESIKDGPEFDAAVFAALIIEENYQDEDFRRILGINIFDDVAWFNKEGFEAALFYASLFFLVESDRIVKRPIAERIKCISKIYEVLIKAEEKSGYRFDKLIDILTSKPAVKKTAVSAAKTKAKAETKPVKKAVKKPTAKPKAGAKTKATAKEKDVKKTAVKPKAAAKTGTKTKAVKKPSAKTSVKAKTGAKPAVKTKSKAGSAKAVKKLAAKTASKTGVKKATAKPKPKKKK
jgi:hypothetical protein